MGNEIIARRVVIHGRVQGVGYRAFVIRHASLLDLAGVVRNLRNGDVECIVEGPGEDVRSFIEELHSGPSLARVGKVEVTSQPLAGLRRPFHVA